MATSRGGLATSQGRQARLDGATLRRRGRRARRRQRHGKVVGDTGARSRDIAMSQAGRPGRPSGVATSQGSLATSPRRQARADGVTLRQDDVARRLCDVAMLHLQPTQMSWGVPAQCRATSQCRTSSAMSWGIPSQCRATSQCRTSATPTCRTATSQNDSATSQCRHLAPGWPPCDLGDIAGRLCDIAMSQQAPWRHGDVARGPCGVAPQPSPVPTSRTTSRRRPATSQSRTLPRPRRPSRRRAT